VDICFLTRLRSRLSLLAASPHRRIATSASALKHQAFAVAGQQGIAGGVIDRYRGTLERRILENWAR
jgi:hypothetical protein